MRGREVVRETRDEVDLGSSWATVPGASVDYLLFEQLSRSLNLV